MKTSTEYRKRKHRITKGRRRTDWRNRTEEIEKVFSQSLQTDMNRHTTTDMRKCKSWGNRTSKLDEDNDLVASSNCCLSCSSGWSGWVFKLEDTQSWTHSPHRILLKLRSHRPRPITRGKSSGDFQTFTNSILGDPQFPLGCSRHDA